MVDAISSILEAEKKADQILKENNEQVKKIILDAEDVSEKIKERAIVSFKLHKKSRIKEAEKNAEEEYTKVIEEGNIKISNMIKSAEKKESSIIETIVYKVLG